MKTPSLKDNNENALKSVTLTSYGGIWGEIAGFSGSCHLITITRVSGAVTKLLVDYWLFQGKDALRNILTLPFKLSEVSAVILTHGHGDHCGQLPKLVKDPEFAADVYMTHTTRSVALLSLKDTAKIAENTTRAAGAIRAKTIKDLQEYKRILSAYLQKWIPRNSKGQRSRQTGLRGDGPGEEEHGGHKKNRNHGGKAIVNPSPGKLESAVKNLKMHNMLPEDYEIMPSKNSAIPSTPLPKELLKKPESPIYTGADIAELDLRIRTSGYNQIQTIAEWVELEFYNAGHVPGSALAFLKIDVGNGDTYNLLMSGDLGRVDGVFHPYGTPEIPKKSAIHAFVHETTYGGKTHPDMQESIRDLGDAIRDAYINNKKAFIIPCFSLERSAAILHHLIELRKQQYFAGEILLDSPLATEFLKISVENAIDPLFRDNLSDLKQIKFVKHGDTREDPNWLEKSKKFKIIVTSSGMANGWPILGYLRNHGNSNDFVFGFVGYQWEWTLGREVAVDQKKIVTVEGAMVEIKARVHHFNGFSAHADEEGLLQIAQFGARTRVKNILWVEPKVILIHWDRTGGAQAYKNKMGRHRDEWKKWIPTDSNILIPELWETTVLYQA